MFYEERLWTAWWVLVVACGSWVVLGILACLFLASSDSSPWTSVFPWFVAVGVLLALVIWSMNALRKLRVCEDGLHVGKRLIAYGYVEGVRQVDHAEAKRLAETMRYSPLRPSTWSHRSRAHGLWWQPWMRDAVYLELKSGTFVTTDRWLIGTRQPRRLLELVQARARAVPVEPGASPDAAPALA